MSAVSVPQEVYERRTGIHGRQLVHNDEHSSHVLLSAFLREPASLFCEGSIRE